MPEHNWRKIGSQLSKAQRVERLIGRARSNDEEDIAYWRNATDAMRGKALYELLLLIHAIGRYPEKKGRFPGFPKRTKT